MESRLASRRVTTCREKPTDRDASRGAGHRANHTGEPEIAARRTRVQPVARRGVITAHDDRSRPRRILRVAASDTAGPTPREAPPTTPWRPARAGMRHGLFLHTVRVDDFQSRRCARGGATVRLASMEEKWGKFFTVVRVVPAAEPNGFFPLVQGRPLEAAEKRGGSREAGLVLGSGQHPRRAGHARSARFDATLESLVWATPRKVAPGWVAWTH